MYVQTDGEELVLPLGHHTSVFQAEVFALLTCAKLESLLFISNCSIAICSDSLAAIKAVSGYYRFDDCTKGISNLQQCSTHFGSGPGHSGIAGNEKEDMLAKQASSSCFTGFEPPVGISVSTICSYIISWAVREQNRLWRELFGCR